MMSQRSTSSTNIKIYRKTSNFDVNFSLYENYANYEKRRLQVCEKTSWGPPSHSNVYPYGESHTSSKGSDKEEELRWPWRKYPQNRSVRVREGGYTGTQLIEARGEDELKPCYVPLIDPIANIRPASWHLASPMWNSEYEVAAKGRVNVIPWWAQPPTESLQPAASGEIQRCESQKWQWLLEKMREERVQTNKLSG